MDENKLTLKELISALESIGYCPCSDISALKTLKSTFEYCGGVDKKDFNKFVENNFSNNEGAAFCALFLLNTVGFISHGGNIRFSWLDARGKAILNAFNQYSLEDIDNFKDF